MCQFGSHDFTPFYFAKTGLAELLKFYAILFYNLDAQNFAFGYKYYWIVWACI